MRRHLDFATVNVSSPNTEKLRDLQGKEALSALLDGVMLANATLPRPLPVFSRSRPISTTPSSLTWPTVALGLRHRGIIATNTTLARA